MLKVIEDSIVVISIVNHFFYEDSIYICLKFVVVEIKLFYIIFIKIKMITKHLHHFLGLKFQGKCTSN